jgi:hypothetical protein
VRWLALAVAAIILAGTAAVIVHVRRNVVPPDCEDSRTITLVRQSLTGHFHLPESTRIGPIRMLAGGWLAFRFVCEADLEIPEAELPPGPRPGTVHYISQLTDEGRRHQVTVQIAPLLIWAPAE